MSNLLINIKKYLNDRGITDEVINASQIKWLNNKIVLPVLDKDGKVLFNKYRRDPETVDNSIPKYTYDKGSKASLYNQHNVNFKSTVWITEGELDALRLMSMGLQAVSSTGGSGTFSPEWADVFKDTPEIFVCYDRDEAGVRGMLRVQKVLPKAKLVFLPEFKGKDVTDYLLQHADIPTEDARSWSIPEPDLKAGRAKQVTAYNRLANEVLEHQRKTKDSFYTKYIVEQIDFYREEVKTKPKRVLAIGNTDLVKAKSVPITDFIKFNSRGYSSCLWHKEKTPSMKYYPNNNKVYCYGGCGKARDTVDVVMALHNCSLKEAIKIILKQ